MSTPAGENETHYAEGRDFLGDALAASQAPRATSNTTLPQTTEKTRAQERYETQLAARSRQAQMFGRQGVEAMRRGDSGARSAAASDAAPGEPPEGAAERRLRELNAEDSPLFRADATPEERAAALGELRQLLAEDPEAAAKRAAASPDDLRAQLGLDSPKLLTAWSKENYNHDAEAVFLSGAIANGYEPSLARELRDYYVHVGQGAAFGGITDEAVADFHRQFEGRVSKEHRDELVAWAKAGFSGVARPRAA